jgi:lipopolysaccharide transport system ATP-binding protein
MTGDSPAIHLQNVSKKYPIYARNFDRVKEALDPWRRQYHHDFWALRDVNLAVKKGETVGILGVNGSGKSTLLQIICSILQPNAGSVAVHGRISALIELGAGFNPELSGRQNAEMNCIISGLSREDVADVMPAIEEFAGIGEFFGQPVNTYSSGMFMRVAFSTAVHVDPEILIIDEALAVGDARFQQKCFRKFKEFQDGGKTILLVTHDRHALPRLCTSAIMLDGGQIVGEGSPAQVAEQYGRFLQLGSSESAETTRDVSNNESPALASAISFSMPSGGNGDVCHLQPNYNPNEHRYGQGGAAIIDYLVASGGTTNPAEIMADGKVVLCVKVLYQIDVETPLVGFTVQSTEGLVVATTHSAWLGNQLRARVAGEVATYRFTFLAHLAAGNWFVNLAVASNESTLLDTRESLIHLYVTSRLRTAGLVSLEASVSEDETAEDDLAIRLDE